MDIEQEFYFTAKAALAGSGIVYEIDRAFIQDSNVNTLAKLLQVLFTTITPKDLPLYARSSPKVCIFSDEQYFVSLGDSPFSGDCVRIVRPHSEENSGLFSPSVIDALIRNGKLVLTIKALTKGTLRDFVESASFLNSKQEYVKFLYDKTITSLKFKLGASDIRNNQTLVRLRLDLFGYKNSTNHLRLIDILNSSDFHFSEIRTCIQLQEFLSLFDTSFSNEKLFSQSLAQAERKIEILNNLIIKIKAHEVLTLKSSPTTIMNKIEHLFNIILFKIGFLKTI